MKVRKIVARLREYNKWRRGQAPYDKVGAELPFTAREIGYLIDDAIGALEEKQSENQSRKTTRKGRIP